MANRLLPSGTPNRSTRYLVPATRHRLFLLSLAAAALLLAGGVAFFSGGARQLASPGDVAVQHATIDMRCAQCHASGTTRGVIDLRCERCHDPSGSERLTSAAHMLVGNGTSGTVVGVDPPPCVVCHTEHRGRRVNL